MKEKTRKIAEKMEDTKMKILFLKTLEKTIKIFKTQRKNRRKKQKKNQKNRRKT